MFRRLSSCKANGEKGWEGIVHQMHSSFHFKGPKEFILYSFQISIYKYIQHQERSRDYSSRILPIDVNVNWGGIIFAHRLYPIFVFACGAVMAGGEVEPSWACAEDKGCFVCFARSYGFIYFYTIKWSYLCIYLPSIPYSCMTISVHVYFIIADI